MMSNISRSNLIIAFSSIIIALCTFIFLVDAKDISNNTSNKIYVGDEVTEAKPTLGPNITEGYYTKDDYNDFTLTGKSEREDICIVAEAQVGINERSGELESEGVTGAATTPYHAWYADKGAEKYIGLNAAWCQTFVCWCADMVDYDANDGKIGIDPLQFIRRETSTDITKTSPSCSFVMYAFRNGQTDKYDTGRYYNTIGSVYLEKGWEIFINLFGSSAEKNWHTAICTEVTTETVLNKAGNKQKIGKWVHGNYSNMVRKDKFQITSNMKGSGETDDNDKYYILTQIGDKTVDGIVRSYGMPYYRSKVYYNLNRPKSSMNGCDYNNGEVYSEWYTEEKEWTLQPTTNVSCTDGTGASVLSWHTSDTCSDATEISTIPTTKRGAVELYAKWDKAPLPQYSITYILGEGAVWKEGVEATITKAFSPGDDVVIYSKDGVARTLEKEGHTFVGWYSYYRERDRYYANKVDEIDSNTVTRNITLYAKWEPIKSTLNLFTVPVDIMSESYGDGVEDATTGLLKYSKIFDYGSRIILPYPHGHHDHHHKHGKHEDYCNNAMWRRGYDFEGWHSSPTTKDAVATKEIIKGVGEQNYYAHWVPIKYDLIMLTNGATIKNAVIPGAKQYKDYIYSTYTVEDTIVFPTANDDMYKENRIFAGWYGYRRGHHSLFSNIPQYGIQKGEIGDKCYWAKWVNVEPDIDDNESMEIIADAELAVYVYYSYDKKYDLMIPIAQENRYFSINVKAEGGILTQNQIDIWLSTSPDPNNEDAILDWQMQLIRENGRKENGRHNEYRKKWFRANDNQTLRFYLPADDEDIQRFFDEGNSKNSRRVYIHVKTITGNVGTYPVNIVKRAIYGQH